MKRRARRQGARPVVYAVGDYRRRRGEEQRRGETRHVSEKSPAPQPRTGAPLPSIAAEPGHERKAYVPSFDATCRLVDGDDLAGHA